MQNQEYLAVGCFMCKNIKLLNLKTEKVTKAFSSINPIENMCHGDQGRLLVLCGRNIMELDSSNVKFKTIQTIPLNIEICCGLSYVPSPYNLIFAADRLCHKVQAISLRSKKLQWMVDKIEGTDIDPYGCMYFPRHNTILVCDLWKKRIVALNPADGSHMTTIPVTGMDPTHGLYLHNDEIFGMGMGRDDEWHYSFLRFSTN